MKKMLVLFFLLQSLSIIYGERKITVERDKSFVRFGPGIFFEKIMELNKGDEVNVTEKENIWWRIDFPKKGFISPKAFQKININNDIFKKMSESVTDVDVSKHELSAGIKGFAGKFVKSENSYLNFENIINNCEIDMITYNGLVNKNKKREDFIKIPYSNNFRDQFSENEFIIGTSFASNVSSMGLYQNKRINGFLNAFGNFLIRETEMYDQRFYFFVLDTEKINAYACPGGIIFISKGLLKEIKNDDELAFVLSHEIAHTIRQHGLKELDKRKHIIQADKRFDELEEELDELNMEQDENILATEKELEEDIFDFYENIINGRLGKYEMEADKIAIIYLIKSGFSPHNAINILKRLSNKKVESTNEHYTSKQIKNRYKDLHKFLKKIPFSKNENKTNWVRIKHIIN